MKTSKYELKVRQRLSGKMVVQELRSLPPQSDYSKHLDLPEIVGELVDVYRFEIDIEVGREQRTFGPFTAACYDSSLENVTWRYKRELSGMVPEPEEDGINISISGTNIVCGFLIECRQLTTWLPWRETWDLLAERGFRIAHYIVPASKLYVGKTQVCWHPENAVLQQTLTYDQLRDLHRNSWDRTEREARRNLA